MNLLKKIIYLFTFGAMISACNNNTQYSGSVSYQIKFTTDDIGIVRSTQADDTVYTQFGDYITSLTPTIFQSRIWTVGYIDKVLVPTTNEANMLQYINQNQMVLPYSDTSRFVDFSANATISFSPVVFGDVRNETNFFAAPQIDFKYFYFIPYYFYQEVTIPAAYSGVSIDMFNVPFDMNPAVIEGNVLKAKNHQMIKQVFPNAQINSYIIYTFGNVDSTFVVNPNGESIPLGNDNPICTDPQNSLIIHSNLYEHTLVNSPQNGEEVVMSGTLSFYTNNLIQVYAGGDNVPYTSDDVFVYAPRFWERLTTRLVTE